MGNLKFQYIYVVSLIVIGLGCSSSNNSDNGLKDFPSFGQMTATIDGESIVLSAKKARQYVSPYLQIAGTNCSERILIGFDIPFATGTYSLDTLGDVFVFINAASSCDGEMGSNSPQSIIEAEVVVTELTGSTVKGSFSISVGEDNIPFMIITNGVFDVEREN